MGGVKSSKRASAAERARLISPVATAVNLVSVFMTKMRGEVYLPSHEVSPATEELADTRRVSFRQNPEDQAVEVVIHFELVGLRGSEKKVKTFELGAEFCLKYAVDDRTVAFTSEEVEAFAKFNAVFNVWPYWREFVQTTTTRLGLPALVLPLHKVKLDSSGSSKHEAGED